MSKRENREADTESRVSPYLLRPARTYEEYLRDRAIADRLRKQLEDNAGAGVSVSGATKEAPSKANDNAWRRTPPSTNPALAVTRQRDRGDSANNQA